MTGASGFGPAAPVCFCGGVQLAESETFESVQVGLGIDVGIGSVDLDFTPGEPVGADDGVEAAITFGFGDQMPVGSTDMDRVAGMIGVVPVPRAHQARSALAARRHDRGNGFEAEQGLVAQADQGCADVPRRGGGGESDDAGFETFRNAPLGVIGLDRVEARCRRQIAERLTARSVDEDAARDDPVRDGSGQNGKHVPDQRPSPPRREQLGAAGTETGSGPGGEDDGVGGQPLRSQAVRRARRAATLARCARYSAVAWMSPLTSIPAVKPHSAESRPASSSLRSPTTASTDAR